MIPLVALLAGVAHARELYTFESTTDLAALRPGNAQAAVCSEGVTEGANALCVDFQPSQWPQVLFRPAAPFDFREAGELAVDLTNPGEESVTFRIRIDDDLRADGTRYCRTAVGTIAPGATQTFAFRFDTAGPMTWGMRGLPSHPGTTAMTEGPPTWSLNFSNIVQFQIFLSSPPRPVRLIVDNIRLRPQASLEGIADRFGQFSRIEWPGKLGSEEEFEQRRAADAADREAHPVPADRDRFGGWLEGPRLAATGFFRTEKVNGKWWLVTPEGTLFFSLGPTGIRTGDTTFTTGRESMFQWLPQEGEPLRRHTSYVTGAVQGPIREGRAMNFYGANLERRYGPDFFTAWSETALARLASWGFNTIANWSDDRLFGRSVPYVVPGGVSGTHNRIPTGNGNTIHDPFDPRFTTNVRNSVRTLAQRFRDDPFCLGWFVDNELSWGSNIAVATGTLSQALSGSPARMALVGQLREKYGEVARLNEAWGTTFATFEAVAAPAAMNDRARSDFTAFARLHARTYFRIVREQLRAEDPNHLYLGVRFAGSATSEVADACAEFCDVISYNIYQRRIEPARWNFLNAYDKPAIIGEFHFGALDRGMLHTGLVAASTQQERAAAYAEYVRSALVHPAFVGAHWFQWVDQPLTGRTRDGENYNIGLVTIIDDPYPEMIESARAVHAEAYRLRCEP
ncbi:MAG: beta-galactosidase [Bryobacterales bacterium]|nr:beta-galactosidase [Bryobacterales bacterium]